MSERKSAQDYKHDLESLLSKTEKLRQVIGERLLGLCKQYPDAPVQTLGDTIIKAKSIGSDRYISGVDVDKQIVMIGRIEKWLDEQHPQQLNLFN